MRRILSTWWPLAASWLLMGAELPALSAVIARLAEPEINLAAYGGIVFPLALIVESPIIMLLAASTALSKDWNSYHKIRRFMMVAGAALTALHILVAFTPLYHLVVEGILGAPAEIVAPARLGLMIMTPWTWSIAYRRFNQGVLIRFGHSRAVGMGTVVRLSADLLVLAAGYMFGKLPGIVVATSAVASGVVSEAIFAGIVVRPVIQRQLKLAPAVDPPVTLRSFADFYFPLALTALLTLIAQPIGSAAISRMPSALASLAVWPVLSGLIFMVRSLGVAYNEVVVALLDEPRSARQLHRFALLMAGITSAFLLALASTPVSGYWFGKVSALSPDLTRMAQTALWIALPLPALSVFQSWYQGTILHSRITRGITEAVVVFLIATAATLLAGVQWGKMTGLYVGVASLGLSTIMQTAWLKYRSQASLKAVIAQDVNTPAVEAYNAASD